MTPACSMFVGVGDVRVVSLAIALQMNKHSGLERILPYLSKAS